MRQIDADELKKVLSEPLYRSTIKDYGEILKYTFVMDIIDNAPTVEPETKVVANVTFNKEQVEELVEKAKADILAQIERPQGEWIEHYSKEMSEKGYFLCSRCKCGFKRFEKGVRLSDLPWIDGQKYELHCIDNYCPNCGASMQKGGAE